MAGAKKKFASSTVGPYAYAAPGEPTNPQPLKPVAIWVPAATKGSKLRPPNRKPASSSELAILLAQIPKNISNPIPAASIIQFMAIGVPPFQYFLKVYLNFYFLSFAA